VESGGRMSNLVSVGGSIAAAIVTPLVISLLSGVIGKSRPEKLQQGSGTISPERISAALTVAVSAAIAAGGIVALFAGLWAVGAGALVIGLCLGGFMAPSLTHVHDVSWSPEGVEGPSSLFGPTLGLKRESIAWPDIATTGVTSSGYWFVQASDGRRVYWSYLHKGHRALADALIAHRPDLTAAAGKFA
jgi:hypothetical protein